MRHGANRAALALFPGYPAGTLFVNVVGSLLIGLLAGWFAQRSSGPEQPLRLFLATGVLGGFTTFSAFSLDVAVLVQRQDYAAAAAYAAGSVILSLAAVCAGLALMRVLLA